MEHSTTGRVKALISPYTLKDGFKVTVTHEANASAKVEIRDHRYKEPGQLVCRLYSFEPEFEKKLMQELRWCSA
jgi:hypothetical protein